MDENNVVTTTTDAAADVEQTETVKTEPAKVEADSAEVEKLKRLLSKANSEANSYKQQLREKQSAEERAAAERAEKEKADAERLAELERIVAVSDYEKKCLALNMDAELASKTAVALADGDMDSVFDCLKDFVDATVTRLNNEALNRQPNLSTGTPPTTNTAVKSEDDKIRQWMGLPIKS